MMNAIRIIIFDNTLKYPLLLKTQRTAFNAFPLTFKTCAVNYSTAKEAKEADTPRYAVKIWEKRKTIEEDNIPYKSPVDWLPFKWHRIRRYSIIGESGDKIRLPNIDLSSPLPGFEDSEELKIANAIVKDIFSLKSATRFEISQQELNQLVRQVQRHPLDFNSLEVHITRLTVRIRHLLLAYKEIKKPKRLHRPLVHTIGQRNMLLKHLYWIDRDRFNWLTELLQLEYKPKPIGLPTIQYTKKFDLRRLTKEYCDNLRNSKMEAYHKELKAQQEAFLKEKEETLAWIAKEEEELGVSETKQTNPAL